MPEPSRQERERPRPNNPGTFRNVAPLQSIGSAYSPANQYTSQSASSR